MLVMTSGANLFRRTHDEVGDATVEQAQLGVCQRGGFLHRGQRFDQHRKLAERDAGDRKVLEGAQRLHAVECFLGHFTFAEEIVLRAGTRAGEAERAPVPDERCVRRSESLRDRTRGAADERGVQRRKLLEHLPDLVGTDHECVGTLNRSRARTVR